MAQVVDDEIIGIGSMTSLFPRTSFTAYISEEKAATFGCFPIDKKAVGTNQISVSTAPYVQDGIVYSNQVRNTTLGERKAAFIGKLRNYTNHAINRGITINGVEYKTDLRSQQEINQLANMLDRRGGTQKFVTRGGSVVTGDVTSAAAIRDAVEAYISAVYANEAALQEQIDAATTLTALNKVDVTSGWPT